MFTWSWNMQQRKVKIEIHAKASACRTTLRLVPQLQQDQNFLAMSTRDLRSACKQWDKLLKLGHGSPYCPVVVTDRSRTRLAVADGFCGCGRTLRTRTFISGLGLGRGRGRGHGSGNFKGSIL